MNLRTLGCSFLLVVLAATSCLAVETKESFSKQITITVSYKYWVILPEDYDAKKKYSLVLFLHGSGERGDDLEAVKKHGPFAKMKELKSQAILIAPQCPKGEGWMAQALAGLVDEVESRYPVDKARIYVTGLSMGGYGAWSLGAFQPSRFAAIVPICGGGDIKDAAKLAKVPIWAFHGDADKAVAHEKEQTMIDAVKAAGGQPKFTIYPGVAHDSWTQTYNNPELYEWLFAQKLVTTPHGNDRSSGN